MEKIKTGLWKKSFSDKEGNQRQSLNGNIEINGQKYWVNIYPNNFKEKDSQPDYQMYLQVADDKIKVEPTVQGIAKGYAQITEDVPF